MPPLAAKAVMKTFHVFGIVQVSPALLDDAVDCSVLNQLPFWDSLILAAAASAGCTTLLTEDMNAGQTALGVKIQHPYSSR